MRRLGSYEGLLPGLLFPYGKRGKPGGNYEGLLLPGFSPFPNARYDGDLCMEELASRPTKHQFQPSSKRGGRAVSLGCLEALEGTPGS